ncbi:sensor histidine kinase [Sphingomonas aracearum]|uniref:histidine kinase n=1 Tax=Sphingomonas aracearum TaxID=2283317 RepID=A0A369VXU4_9SPHN|nr:histidine kinase dimerization/phosphoacceptor domain -containing protein [Sphingomonas aracearum]RDE06659.1 HAMP domain-containing protein [Sphingomonas aracearum]
MAGLPTGTKIFLILSAALLPLAVIAFVATLKTTQNFDQDARARLRLAASESGRKLAIELVGDMTALRVALNALDADAGDAPSCARAQGVFAQQAEAGTRFAVVDAAGRPLCGAAFPADLALPGAARGMPVAARVVPDRGLVLAISSNDGDTTAQAFFPSAFLAEVSQPSGFAPPYETVLEHDGEDLALTRLPPRQALERRETLIQVLGLADLQLRMTVRSAPITSPLLIALLLPILMWAAAAGISWFVVDRLLIRPLRKLRASVASFTPGEEIDVGEVRALPAQEIRELGETFRAISRTVAQHEAGLAEGLVRQTKLTREVHHRVKNNLQVIGSLINFHARGARSKEASAAYASIQRRVDALAVVHRHHFAEMEESRGLSLRAVIGELASNIRATAPEASHGMAITLEVEPFLLGQDAAIAVAFLITELVELALACNPVAHIRVSAKGAGAPDRAIIRVSSPALVEGDELAENLRERYGRVIEGLSRQLRSKLHHDPLVGAYEIAVPVLGRD